MSRVKINLKDIDKLINALEVLKKDIDNLSKDIPKLIVDEGKDYLDRQYAKSPNRNDPNIDFSNIYTGVEKIENGYKLYAKGPDMLYEEFGTGDEGQKHQHPDKSKYSLNAYNSGQHIRDVSSLNENSYTKEDLEKIGITSGRFWYYEKDGIGHYTQGVPAGKEMWNTRNYLKSNKVANNILRKRGKEIRDKFIKSIER